MVRYMPLKGLNPSFIPLEPQSIKVQLHSSICIAQYTLESSLDSHSAHLGL